MEKKINTPITYLRESRKTGSFGFLGLDSQGSASRVYRNGPKTWMEMVLWVWVWLIDQGTASKGGRRTFTPRSLDIGGCIV